MTVACLLASPYADECKNYSGLFIPLPTLNWWYMDTTNSRISSIKGDATYLPNAGVTDEVANSALCVYPLRQNAYYNKTKRECSCETNYFKNNDGECVDTSGYVDPTLRYGKKIDLIKERDGFIVLNQNLSDLTEISKPPLTPCQAGYIGQGNDCISECQMVENLIQNGKISQDKVVAARAIASADTPGGCPLIAVPIIPTKTNAQICSEFMINSIWSGEKNDQGGLICDCKSGYQLNEQRTNCVITPVVPVIDRNQGCKDRYGTNSIWDGTKDNSGKYQCSCVEGYNWDEGNAQCIVNAAVTENKIDNSKTEVVKQKGFWSRVWGWFRF